MMRKRTKIVVWVAAIALTLGVVLPGLAVGVLRWVVLPSGKLTRLVEEQVSEQLDATLVCGDMDLTFFETFPFLGIRLEEGQLTAQEDSLLSFHRLVASFSVPDFVFEQRIVVRRLLLDQPHIHVHVDSCDRMNWEALLSAEGDTTSAAGVHTSAAGDTTFASPFEIQRLRVRNGYLCYDDRLAKRTITLEGLNVTLKGTEKQAFHLRADAGALRMRADGGDESHFAVQIKGDVSLSEAFDSVALRQAELEVNGLPFDVELTVDFGGEVWSVDGNIALRASALSDLLDLIPRAYLSDRHKIDAKGEVLAEAAVHGAWSDSILPDIDLRCRLSDGALHITDMPEGIDSLALDVNVHIDGTHPAASRLTIDTLTLKGLNSLLQAQGQVSDLMQSNRLRGAVKGRMDFTRLAEMFIPSDDSLLVKGDLNVDLSADFLLADLLEGRYDRLHIHGGFDIDTLDIRSAKDSIDIAIRQAHFGIDSTRSTSRFITGSNLLSARFSADSLHLRYGSTLDTHLAQLTATAKTDPAVDTAAFPSLITSIRIEALRTRLPDSAFLIARKAHIRGGIRPAATDKRQPNAYARFTADTLRYFALPLRAGMQLNLCSLTVEALPYRDAMRQQRQAARTDSSRTRTDSIRPDSARTRRTQRNTQAIAASVDTSGVAEFLRNWEVRGKMGFQNARLFSRSFPLPMRMEHTEVAFATNTVTFTGARLHLGKSDLTLTGEALNIRRALIRGGTLRGNFDVSASYIDCNQLLNAISRGMQNDQAAPAADTASIATMDIQQLADTVSDTDTVSPLLILPATLDLTLRMNVQQADYNDLRMTDINGEVRLCKQSLNLRRLHLTSNLGSGDLTLYYTAPDRRGAQAGFDLSLQGLLVNRVIALYPGIDSLLPMMRSFEGVLDCHTTATCAIDSGMNILLPSLNAFTTFRGKDLVLLDGETFTELSRTLMFKNKKRNSIDSIAVDLAIRDNHIEVFPFLLEMDRYRVAVVGTQNLDMTFNYHLSVLRSPVPFKLGIDITGDIDHPHYRITRCRYRNTFDPAREQDLIATKTNILAELRHFIHNNLLEPLE